MRLSRALRADARQRVPVDGDRVVAGGKVLEGIVPVGVRLCLDGCVRPAISAYQCHCHTGEGTIHGGPNSSILVVDIPDQRSLNAAVSDQPQVKGVIHLALLQREQAIVPIGVDSTILTHLAGCRRIPFGKEKQESILDVRVLRSREQVVEMILAILIGKDLLYRISGRIERSQIIRIHDVHAYVWDSSFSLILESVLIRVKPHAITDLCRLRETKVHVRGIGRLLRQGDRRRGRGINASVRAVRRTAPRICRGVVIHRHLRAIHCSGSSSDPDGVGSHGKPREAVCSVGVGRRRDFSSATVQDRPAIAIEQCQRHSLKRRLAINRTLPVCVGVVIDEARNRATNGDISGRLVVGRVAIDLIVLAHHGAIRDGVSPHRIADPGEDVQG